jgi:ferredoxin-NADP reductase
VLGPFGGLDHRDGGQRQIWIAGGTGVTPFISWIRSLDSGFAREVEFWYSVRDPATLSIATTSRRRRGSIRRCACISSPMPAMMKALARGLRRRRPAGACALEDFGAR